MWLTANLTAEKNVLILTGRLNKRRCWSSEKQKNERADKQSCGRNRERQNNGAKVPVKEGWRGGRGRPAGRVGRVIITAATAALMWETKPGCDWEQEGYSRFSAQTCSSRKKTLKKENFSSQKAGAVFTQRFTVRSKKNSWYFSMMEY